MADSKTSGRGRLLTRWGLLAIATLLLFAGVSCWVGGVLWDQVAGRSAAFWIYLLWMATILGGAAMVAGFLVRLFFPAYEEQIRPGSRPQAPEGEEEFLAIQRTANLFQPLSVYYSVFFLLAALGLMFVAQSLSRGALFQFKVVQLEAMSRSADPEELVRFLHEVRELQLPDEVERFVHKLPDYYESDFEAVREAAFDTTAVMAHRMNLSVYLLEEAGQLLQQRWEPQLLVWLYQNVSPALRHHFVLRTTPLPALVHALARIARPEDREFFHELVQNPATPDALFVGAAIGLGNLPALESAPALIAAIPRRQGKAQTRTFWALERIGRGLEPDAADEELDDRVLSLLNGMIRLFPRLDDAGLCGIVQAIWAFQHSAMTDPLIELFESKRGALTCPRVELQEPVGPPQVYIKADKLRWLLLNVLADIGTRNGDLRAWVKHSLAKSYDEQVMRGLRQLDAQLQRMEDEAF